MKNYPDRNYRDQDEFGGGHCPEDDVMYGESIWTDARNRYENEIYWQESTEEIINGMEGLWQE